MAAFGVIPGPPSQVHVIREDHNRRCVGLRCAGPGFHQPPRDIVDDPAVIVWIHKIEIGIKDLERDPRQLGRRYPRIDTADFQRAIQSSDVLIKAKWSMPKRPRRLGEAVAKHDGAVKNRDFRLGFRDHFSGEIDLTLLNVVVRIRLQEFHVVIMILFV